jgi:hypothetical protein
MEASASLARERQLRFSYGDVKNVLGWKAIWKFRREGKTPCEKKSPQCLD